MEMIAVFITETIQYAPFLIAFFLTINSVGLPVSEDVLVITAGVLSVEFPHMTIPLYLGCLVGAYLGDISSYWIWRLLGSALLERPFWKKRIKPTDLQRFNGYFENRGYAVLIIGRFIPFGVRVLICLSAGISKYHFAKFALFDFIAALLSTGIIFLLAFTFGETIKHDLNKVKFVLFIALIIFALIFFLYKKMFAKPQDKTLA